MKRIIALVCLMCLGLTAGLYAQSKDGKAPAAKTTYTGTGAEIEFEKKVYTNIGKKPLILDDVISSCDCTEVEWSKAPVMPGKTGTIKATYTAKNVGLISKRLTVLSNANTDRVILQLKGEVK